jgi:hypothetical protein
MVVPGRGARGERLIARFHGFDDHARQRHSVLIAALTLAASSGVTSVTPWWWVACSTTFDISSSSVDALAVKPQPGTTSLHAMCFGLEPSCTGTSLLLRYSNRFVVLEMPKTPFV